MWGRTQDSSRRPASMQISGNTVTKVSDDFHYSTAVSRIQSFRHFFCEVLVHRAMRGTRIGAAPPAESALRRPGRALRSPPRRGPRPGAGCPSETPHVRTGWWQDWLRLEFRWTRTGAFPVRSPPVCGRLAHAARPAAFRSPAPPSPPPAHPTVHSARPSPDRPGAEGSREQRGRACGTPGAGGGGAQGPVRRPGSAGAAPPLLTGLRSHVPWGLPCPRHHADSLPSVLLVYVFGCFSSATERTRDGGGTRLVQ